MRTKYARTSIGLAALCALAAGCSNPGVEPWHTERLTSEFTASKAKDVQSLADYQALEDRLWAELDAKVYSQVPTGPEQLLVRYSAGSAADPRDDDPDWNRTFELVPDDPEAARGGVLLLHGMSDAPYSLRALGQAFHRSGYRVVGLRLPGHGTAPSGLRFVRGRDMIAAVRLAMGHLESVLGEKPIHMVGYSTGAPLALDHSLEAMAGNASPVPASLILISPAIRIHGASAMAGPTDFLSGLPGLGGLAWLSVQPEFDPYKYNSFATNAGDVVRGLTRSVDQRIVSQTRNARWVDGEPVGESTPAVILPPILVFKSTVDTTVTTEAVVDNLLVRLAPDRHELVLFDINRHAAGMVLLASDPGPLTERLLRDESLPFCVKFVTNASTSTSDMVMRRKPPFSGAPEAPEPLDLAWPSGVLSLSHVAVPIPPDDPLYGSPQQERQGKLYLGQLGLYAERGLVALPASMMLRMRYNPFYAGLEKRALEWLEQAEAP